MGKCYFSSLPLDEKDQHFLQRGQGLKRKGQSCQNMEWRGLPPSPPWMKRAEPWHSHSPSSEVIHQLTATSQTAGRRLCRKDQRGQGSSPPSGHPKELPCHKVLRTQGQPQYGQILDSRPHKPWSWDIALGAGTWQKKGLLVCVLFFREKMGRREGGREGEGEREH